MPQMMRMIATKIALKKCQTNSRIARKRTLESGSDGGIQQALIQNFLWLSISSVTGPSLINSTSM